MVGKDVSGGEGGGGEVIRGKERSFGEDIGGKVMDGEEGSGGEGGRRGRRKWWGKRRRGNDGKGRGKWY